MFTKKTFWLQHTDWFYCRGKWIIALDNAPRLITDYEVFDNAIAKNAIKVLKDAMNNYGKLESILTDRETQFYASAGKKAKGVLIFEKFLAENGIRHIAGSESSTNEWKD